MPRESVVTAPNAPGFSGDLFHDSFHAYVGAWSFGVPGLFIRSYFTSPNLRLKTPALTLVVRPLKSAEVRRFPSRLRYFAAVLLRFLVAELSAAAEA